MSEKSELYQQLKGLGVTFEKSYVQYTVSELEDLARSHFDQATTDEEPDLELPPVAVDDHIEPEPEPEPVSAPEPPIQQKRRIPQNLQELVAMITQMFQAKALREGHEILYKDNRIPISDRGADRAGLTYSRPKDLPVRIDTLGRIWFQDEVAKPAIPKARMTRKTRYIDTGTKEHRTFNPDGSLDEIYEVAGDERRELTTTVTLPSWQVGKYRDVRLPFIVHSYNEAKGFDYFEINAYFGGEDFVPSSIKKVYVGNHLCYDIPSVRDNIETQFAQLQRSR